jgi:hypothetical protein
MMVVKSIQTIIVPHQISFEKEVRCEKDLEKFIIYFLKYMASHGEATTQTIFKNLQDTGLLNSGFKLSPRRIGRGVLSDRVWFKGRKHYDPKTKQELTFWRYET